MLEAAAPGFGQARECDRRPICRIVERWGFVERRVKGWAARILRSSLTALSTEQRGDRNGLATGNVAAADLINASGSHRTDSFNNIGDVGWYRDH
jgi:hypothetical protein